MSQTFPVYAPVMTRCLKIFRFFQDPKMFIPKFSLWLKNGTFKTFLMIVSFLFKLVVRPY